MRGIMDRDKLLELRIEVAPGITRPIKGFLKDHGFVIMENDIADMLADLRKSIQGMLSQSIEDVRNDQRVKDAAIAKAKIRSDWPNGEIDEGAGWNRACYLIATAIEEEGK